MTPIQASVRLRSLAEYIDLSEKPSISYVRKAIGTVLASVTPTATERTVGVSLRDAVFDETVKLMPGAFVDMYDTNVGGKGFANGRVSLAVRPSAWVEPGIIGGILLSGVYGDQFKSESPDPVPDDFKHSAGGGIVSMPMEAKYYNKTLGGGEGNSSSLGNVDVLLNEREEVEEVQIVSPGLYKEALQRIIDDILSNPPAVAQGPVWIKNHQTPQASTPKALLNALLKQQRTDVKKSEIDLVARAMSNSAGTPFGMAQKSVEDFFRSRGWAIDPNN